MKKDEVFPKENIISHNLAEQVGHFSMQILGQFSLQINT